MPKLSFYDLKAKRKFETDKYEIRVKSGRRFAVAQSPNGKYECWRVLPKK